ncbi:hypothetical protein OIDMADRAFT_114565 [Oidiodendron maius Zn]|uniref:Dolichyl-diphosphooligosaccharide--protein glycosyltransferase subunit OST2 n=1 Tax=Oidiodendron maius (strain Zn) TaxID=913774 RepID=A0A0C3DRZ2_OIDMZ|nr:hypothetical protein OIDMADRAFT_114565 [Oidiodendron maius Zn]
MAPKRNPRDATPSSTTATTQSSGTSTPIPPPIKLKQSSNLNPPEIALGVWQHYVETTPQRTKLIDVFMVFLVAVGCLQFAYCLISGNYPFNAFLSGFSATVGQFVLTASLRIQTNVENKAEFSSVSPERYGIHLLSSSISRLILICF